MRRWIVPMALVHMVAVPAWPALRHDGPIAPISGCAQVVSPGASIQAALSQQPQGATICVTAGTYPIRSELRPKSGQSIRGIGSPRPTLHCAVVFCLDGADGPADVTILSLRLEGARNANIRLGNGWVVRSIESRGADEGGILVRGDGATIASSYVHHNGAFGIRAVGAKDLTIRGNEIASNPTDPNVPAGLAGGVKLNAVDGLTMQRNNVHDNGGGAGIWLDIDSRHFAVTGNRSVNNAGDGIRVEISCNGIIDANTVTGSSEVGIDLFNAHDITLTSNVVHPSAGAAFGIRMLSNGRDTSQGDGSCMIAGSFPNSNNRARSNLITLEDLSSRVGVEVNGGLSSGNSWRSNSYAVPECSASIWQWWDGTTSQQVGFSGWQSLGQDRNGSCRRAT